MTDDAQTLPIPPDPATLEQRLRDAIDPLPRFENSDDYWQHRHLLTEAANEIGRCRDQVEAYREHHHAIGQHLLATHKPGEVDEAAVAILDGYHVGAREVAGGGQGEPGETTLQAALRLLKLAHARGAFAAAEHVVTPAAAPTGPTFRVALIDSTEALPDWVDAAEFKDAGFEDGYRACVAVQSNGKIRYHWDGGEAEDNLYLRDWAWVAPALDDAYRAGRDDVLSGAVPPTWDQLCDKIRALGLRCYIRGGEGVAVLMIDGPAVYYAPEGIHAPSNKGKRIADIYNRASGLFQPAVVDGPVVDRERLTATTMSVSIKEYGDLLAAVTSLRQRQDVVERWTVRTFGPEMMTPHERVLRVLEEALELAQAEGLPVLETTRLVDYVYARPAGEPAQEVGGLRLTILAYCAAKGLLADDCEAAEVARVLAKDPQHFRDRNVEKAHAGVGDFKP